MRLILLKIRVKISQNSLKMQSKLLVFKITQVLEKHEKRVFTIYNMLSVVKQNVHN